jgi:hypothetical protein
MPQHNNTHELMIVNLCFCPCAAVFRAGKRGITFMPFSEGPRNCVGQSLAKMEVMTLLAKLLANFSIELAPEMGGRPGIISRESTHLTLQTAGTKGIRCHLHPRSEAVGTAVKAAC